MAKDPFSMDNFSEEEEATSYDIEIVNHQNNTDNEDNEEDGDGDEEGGIENNQEEGNKDEEIQEENEEEDEEGDYEEDEETGASILLREYHEKGIISIPEELKERKNLSGEELMELLQKEAEEKALNKLHQEGYNEEIKTAITFLRNGGSIEALKNIYETDSYADTDISDDYNLENREKVIKAYHRATGVPEKNIDRLYEISVANQETYEDALEAQEFFKAEKENKFKSQEEARAKEIEDHEKALTESKNKTIQLVRSGKIGSIQLDKREQEEVIKALYEPTELIKVKEGDKERVVRATKVDLLMEEYNKNPEWQVIFVRMLLDNFEFKNIRKTVEKARDKQTLDVLNSKLNKKAINNLNKSKTTETNYVRRYVGDINIS